MKKRLLTDTEPKLLLKYFEDFTFIPRESGNEKGISDYLIAFAKENGLEYYRDEYFNVLIKKPASPGYEDHDTIILQAHIDMVCEKNREVEFDFENDPIVFEVEDDKIISKETTLGADNGIGLAFCLAALSDPDLKHPAIEFLGTADEERGMSGIENFNFDLLKGSKVINMDSGDEGIMVVGCAGGPVVRNELPITKLDADPEKAFYEITLRGLIGGHSGEDIHRGRANANKLFARLLMAIRDEIDYDLADISGGLKYNAIPRNAECIIAIDKDNESKLMAVVENYQAIYKDEYRVNDPNIKLSCAAAPHQLTVLSEDSKMRILDYITFCETGIVRMDMDNPEYVESSLSLGVVTVKEDFAEIWVMTRSSKTSQFNAMLQKIVRLTESFDGKYEIMSNCPAWEYDPNSVLKKTFTTVYKEQYGTEPKSMVMHAGLETSEFAKKIERKLDMISLGPDVRNFHAPGEYVIISSVKRTWECVKKFIESL